MGSINFNQILAHETPGIEENTILMTVAQGCLLRASLRPGYAIATAIRDCRLLRPNLKPINTTNGFLKIRLTNVYGIYITLVEAKAVGRSCR